MFDDRLTQALPYVHRAHQQRQTHDHNQYVREFDNWADEVTENRDIEVDILKRIIHVLRELLLTDFFLLIGFPG